MSKTPILKAPRDRDAAAAKSFTVEHLNEVVQTIVRGFVGV